MSILFRAGMFAVTVIATAGISLGAAQAQQCGNTGGGFDAWKGQFERVAASQGVGRRGLSALRETRYLTKTISADRNQRSFKLSLQQFMQKRGANTIASRGKRLKQQHARLFDAIERRYGVPAGPLIAIWGMETGFGGYLGNQNVVSSVATLAYDCRRSEFFTRHLLAALALVDRGALSPNAVGAAHGEIGQTQFLAGNVLQYGVDGDGDGRLDMIRSRADALASTANFLRAHGWRAGSGYQPGEANFRALQGWNAAGVYQKAIAIIGQQIDG